MKKIFIYCLVSLFMSFGINRINGQVSTNPTADSMQRVMMKDSLQITDSLITVILELRNNYLQQTQVIRNDSSLSDISKDSTIRNVGIQTNQSIKSLLGDEKFSRYESIINNRMRQRMNNRVPLANNN